MDYIINIDKMESLNNKQLSIVTLLLDRFLNHTTNNLEGFKLLENTLLKKNILVSTKQLPSQPSQKSYSND